MKTARSYLDGRRHRSPLTEGRGLKNSPARNTRAGCWSPLTEGRGLKSKVSAGADLRTVVAPHGGAWIEKHSFRWSRSAHRVAPHGGAWIEKASTSRWYAGTGTSPLTEGRGLKSVNFNLHVYLLIVAPHGGAWIEKYAASFDVIRCASPLTEGRGLKRWRKGAWSHMTKSPLTEGRGLKRVYLRNDARDGRRPSRRGVD